MSRMNSYMMEVQQCVLDCYDRNGDIDPKPGYKTTSDILAKVRDEFGQGMAVEIASQEIDEIEGGLWLC